MDKSVGEWASPAWPDDGGSLILAALGPPPLPRQYGREPSRRFGADGGLENMKAPPHATPPSTAIVPATPAASSGVVVFGRTLTHEQVALAAIVGGLLLLGVGLAVAVGAKTAAVAATAAAL